MSQLLGFPIRRGNFGDSAINKGYIAYFSMLMRKTALFLLPVWNLTSPSCSSTHDFLYSVQRKNSGDSRTLTAEIGTFMFVWI